MIMVQQHQQCHMFWYLAGYLSIIRSSSSIQLTSLLWPPPHEGHTPRMRQPMVFGAAGQCRLDS